MAGECRWHALQHAMAENRGTAYEKTIYKNPSSDVAHHVPISPDEPCHYDADGVHEVVRLGQTFLICDYHNEMWTH